jgi:sugar phosphate isomerase/epimerase
MSRFKVSAGLWILDTFAERYVPGGYHDPMDFDRQLDLMSGIPGLDGLGVLYPPAPFPSDPVKLQEKLTSHNLAVGDITVENYVSRKWKHGPFATNEREIWKENIRLCKEAVDFAAAIPGTTLTLWPAHDGFDYPFQVDYREGWRNMTESLREICGHNPKVRIAVEYKQKDPRQRQYVSNVGKTMMLLNDVGAPNAAAALDTGHALMSQESLAESAVILHSHGRLGTVHLNDNYRDADPDMIFGAVAFWDNLELYYYLKKMGYQGWHEIDITSPRDDRGKSAALVVKMARLYERLAEKLLAKSALIEENLTGYRFTDNMDLITDILFP